MDDESSREERSAQAVDGAGEEMEEGDHDVDDADDEDGGGSVAGEFLLAGPVEPERPDLENAIFVVAGAFLTILAVGGLIDPAVYTLRGLATLVGAGLLVTLVCFGFFGLLNPDT